MTRDTSIGVIGASLTEISRLANTREAVARRQRTSGVALDNTGVHILRSIRDHGPIRLGQLATIVEIEVSQLSKKVRRLVDEGLVTQEIDPAERRAVRLEATAKGRRAYLRYRAAAERILVQAFADWADDDLAAAAEVLSRMTETFQATDSGTRPRPVRAKRA